MFFNNLIRSSFRIRYFRGAQLFYSTLLSQSPTAKYILINVMFFHAIFQYFKILEESFIDSHTAKNLIFYQQKKLLSHFNTC